MNPNDEPATKRDLKLLESGVASLRGDLEFIEQELKKIHDRFDKLAAGVREERLAIEAKIDKQLAGFRWARKSDHPRIIADWHVAQLKKRLYKTESLPS